VITAALRDALERYGDRGYRYLLLEAGHVAQNVNLAGSALRIGTLDLGGFLDGQLAAALGLDEQVPLYAVALGRPSTTDPQDVRRPATGQGRSPVRF
jgi:SagB-type dehydrogenase family enzyme